MDRFSVASNEAGHRLMSMQGNEESEAFSDSSVSQFSLLSECISGSQHSKESKLLSSVCSDTGSDLFAKSRTVCDLNESDSYSATDICDSERNHSELQCSESVSQQSSYGSQNMCKLEISVYKKRQRNLSDNHFTDVVSSSVRETF